MRRPRGVHFGEMLLDYVTHWDGGRIGEYLEMRRKGWIKMMGQFCYETLGGYTVRASEPRETAPGSLYGVKWEMTR